MICILFLSFFVYVYTILSVFTITITIYLLLVDLLEFLILTIVFGNKLNVICSFTTSVDRL